MLDDSELNVEVIKNVYGFFVMKEELKLNQKTKVKYACRLCNSADKQKRRMSNLMKTFCNTFK